MGMDRLEDIVASSICGGIAPEVTVVAESVRAGHEPGVAAIIAYGSCLRGVAPCDTLIDLYVLTDGSMNAASALARMACRLVPPNIYYAEAEFRGLTIRCKYALMPLDLFIGKMTPRSTNPYFWARFAQPCRMVYARDDAMRSRVVEALSQASRTMIAASLPLTRPGDGPIELWERGLAETYRTELRSEPAGRARQIVEANAGYYASVTEAVLGTGWTAPLSEPPHPLSLRLRRVTGKALSVLRLLKAAFTFQGGADYLAWKISRHSGVSIELKPWQRRHPIVGGLWLLPGLIRRGAVR